MRGKPFDRDDAAMVARVHEVFCRGIGLLRPGLGLLFPPRCAYCSAELPDDEGPALCTDCRQLLGPLAWPGCRRCGATGLADPENADGCPSCQHLKLHFDTAIPLGEYRDRLRPVVLRMKRPSHEPLATAMAGLLVLRRKEQMLAFHPNVVVPVPMHWRRRARQGTNSPDLMAKRLSGLLGLPVRRRLLARRRNTLPQNNLSPKRRFGNVRGAFCVQKNQPLAGARVLLVDDVLTTGATCSEAARVLKRAGAESVAAVVIARAQGADSS